MQPMPQDVQAAFDAFAPAVRHRLAGIRAMIFAIAAEDARIGAITEALKWGEPAYLTAATRSGSTIRLGQSRRSLQHAAIHFICHTSLVAEFRERFGDRFAYDGNRSVLLPVSGDIEPAPIEMLLASALTYHLRPRLLAARIG